MSIVQNINKTISLQSCENVQFIETKNNIAADTQTIEVLMKKNESQIMEYDEFATWMFDDMFTQLVTKVEILVYWQR